MAALAKFTKKTHIHTHIKDSADVHNGILAGSGVLGIRAMLRHSLPGKEITLRHFSCE